MTSNTCQSICLQFFTVVLLILSGCANAQEEGTTIRIKGNGEIAFFFHDDDGTVKSQGWLFGEGSAGDTSLGKSGKHLSLVRRQVLKDGNQGGLEIITWQNIQGGSEIYFPDFSEEPYQMPSNIKLTLSNCDGLTKGVYSGDMTKNAGILAEAGGNLGISFAASPLQKGLLFLQQEKPNGWKYLTVSADGSLSPQVDCAMLAGGVREHTIQFPTGSMVQGSVYSEGEGEKLVVYKLPPNLNGGSAPDILVPENMLNSSLVYDFNIIPANQRNLFLGRRIYRLLGNDLLSLGQIELPPMNITKEYVTEGGFSVTTEGDFHAVLAIYGLDIPMDGKVPSVNKRSQWRIFGKGSEGGLETRLPDIPASILKRLTGGDYIRVYNSVAIHLYQFREKPGDSAFKNMAALLDGKLEGYRDRIEYRAWLKELD
jgi:hypothetical protein